MTASPIDAYLARLHQDWLPDRSGAVADYIPPLALADPDSFGIAITTTEGHSYEVGDSRGRFTIQSMSKPFTYGLALARPGLRRGRREGRGRAERRGLQLDQPGAGQRPAAQPDDQRRRDHLDLAGRRRLGGGAGAAGRRLLRPLRRAPARGRHGGLRIRARHRPPQPRDRPHAARLRRARGRPRRGARPLLPPVLGERRLPRPQPDGGDAGQRRRQSAAPASGCWRATSSTGC